ncbi:hypothetical protein OG883_05600 [Streptomyces sp. NBC_01142]|uniref:hypothetical protein n=1 Tax=Streptomyces sp. NBC_01142 TaxID=2975865 RepID=UPI0022539E9A|nr:hypothetical protein [Streptomyces sp. NBC_01142]MCX4819388.1 hypothetical protein [Streptomyces sp. NBC_01142]
MPPEQRRTELKFNVSLASVVVLAFAGVAAVGILSGGATGELIAALVAAAGTLTVAIVAKRNG